MSNDQAHQDALEIDKTVIRLQDAPSSNSIAPPALTHHAEPIVGSVIGGSHKIIRELGAGGMSIVYEAIDLTLNRKEAIKLLSPKLQKNNESLVRFDLEAKATSKLNHKNIVQVFQCGLHDDQPFLAMEYIPGQSLGDLLREKKTLNISDTLTVVLQICDALEEAHQHKIVHRDLKPTNIVLFDNDIHRLKILDFGIAKILSDTTGQSLTKTGDVFGSPLYMSPEQCSGLHVDKRSDIYSLGCIMYECLTGQPPHVGNNALATIIKHQQEKPLSLKEATLGGHFPEGLEIIVAKMLAKSPSDRYRCIEELKFEIEGFQSSRSSDDNPWADGASPPGTDFFNDVQHSNLRNLQMIDLSLYHTQTGGNAHGDGSSARRALQLSALIAIALTTVAVVGHFGLKTYAPEEKEAIPVSDRSVTGATTDTKIEEKSSKEERDAIEQAEFAYDKTLAARLKTYPNITTLNCSDFLCGDSGWKLLEKFKHLKDLDLSRSNISDEELSYLTNLPLQIVYLSDLKLSVVGLGKLQHIRSLRKLSLCNMELCDSALDNLNPMVEELDLSDNPRLTIWGISKLSSIKHLRRLRLGSDITLDSKAAQVLGRMKHLRYLQVDGSETDSKHVDELRGLLPECMIEINLRNAQGADQSSLSQQPKNW